MGRIRRGWYERETKKKINAEWIKSNCRITNREMELLNIIKDRKMVRRDMLEIISPSYRNLGKSRTKILNRSITKMFRKHILDKVHEERDIGIGGNNPCIVALDRGGSFILGIRHRRRIIHHMMGEYVKRILPINYNHINMINQSEVDTILFCEDTGSEILEWIHEKPYKLYFGEEDVCVIPDIYLTLKLHCEPPRAFKTLHAFLEIDTGKEDKGNKAYFPTIKEKLVKYRKLKVSNKVETPYFPLILLVTMDNDRIHYFNKQCKEFGLEGFGIYQDNYIKFLKHLSGYV